MRDKILGALFGALALVTAAVTGWSVKREFLPSRSSAAQIPHARTQSDWVKYTAAGHGIGADRAPVTIVEFADFQCPFCAEFERELSVVRSRHPGSIRLIFRHYPLSIHPLALPAVRASECAADQQRFTEMHDLLYAYQDSLGDVSWQWYAKRAGITDTTRFMTCMQQKSDIVSLARDTTAASALGVSGTPTLLINGLRLDGAPTLDSLEAYVSRAAGRDAPVRPGA